jgi:benzoate/toluate 1,2-dioxygenase reductase subunit
VRPAADGGGGAKHFQAQGIAPASFHYEKFVTSQPVAVAA